MQLSAKTQNACLAMMELARRHANPRPAPLKSIAEDHCISSQFLVQILLQLKRAGLVQSTRGASGGYRLTQSPADISLLDIVHAMEGTPSCPMPSGDHSAACILHETWQDITKVFHEQLASTSLASLADKIPSRTGDMYYI